MMETPQGACVPEQSLGPVPARLEPSGADPTERHLMVPPARTGSLSPPRGCGGGGPGSCLGLCGPISLTCSHRATSVNIAGSSLFQLTGSTVHIREQAAPDLQLHQLLSSTSELSQSLPTRSQAQSTQHPSPQHNFLTLPTRKTLKCSLVQPSGRLPLSSDPNFGPSHQPSHLPTQATSSC